jgi:hypothetical protein
MNDKKKLNVKDLFSKAFGSRIVHRTKHKQFYSAIQSFHKANAGFLKKTKKEARHDDSR